ncbi:Hypothetical Protein CGB_B9770C [Cryptococcus gattii WM276]|uniref:HNH nuclease domain-containing protein n=1 Tax=Cryptococcus gattii serotype B (strain WM276 / ATCC MYA-4071) TaxID=367775 RepID=E6R1K2_CRYGW|nr:Hypothetical Protein CGB_B9770C [Cryptococcus gattii WM276]ADV20659.1 Hypothetical Protein CGB_B9770C [Cryptococcus gattii WM276]
MTIYYPLALDLWDYSSSIVIRSTKGTRIATFPLDFISRGGDNSWSYVLRGGIIKDEYGRVLDPNDCPSAGVFFFSQEDPQLAEKDVSFSRGPEYFSSIKAPNPEGSFSTRSDSKRSSIDQSRFRSSLLARDGMCVVSGAHWESCTPAHIVPASRPDLYERIYGDQGGLPMFRASVGFLLRDDLHHAFDRLMFSFYRKARQNGMEKQYHPIGFMENPETYRIQCSSSGTTANASKHGFEVSLLACCDALQIPDVHRFALTIEKLTRLDKFRNWIQSCMA